MAYKLLCILICALVLGSCNLLSESDNSRPVVCITFDDQFSNVYNIALPVLNAHGFRASCFVNSEKLGSPGRLTSQQVLSLYQDYGWEIGGHFLRHENLEQLSFAQAEYAIEQDYYNLLSLGVNPRSFAIPSGRCPAEYYPLITKHYLNIRGSSDFAMHNPIDRHSLGYLPYQTGWSVSIIQDRIRRGIENREAIIVIGFHKIDDSSESYTDNCSLETFSEIVSYIANLGLEVMPLAEAVDLNL